MNKLTKLLSPPNIPQLCEDHENRLQDVQDYVRKWREMQPAIGSAAMSHRKQANLSLREVARRMEISAGYLSDLELGKRAWGKKVAANWMKVMRDHAKATAALLSK